ncbi:ABC-type dipeptide/oligopeptide/nickel transport system, ATPase component [Methylobacterium aquaticum]|uniref:ABC-type dipeptide/oligopeptide/nickel transport system, ATPase component n=1 Tax=Methylobacterium aquaticum TaxID=270351 RepID=A0A0C6FQ89_9HYPH|nr:ABC-type dipeptide/oligopeptide/nickel transport system, ATPase component [Methylobacterium aquaticum]
MLDQLAVRIDDLDRPVGRVLAVGLLEVGVDGAAVAVLLLGGGDGVGQADLSKLDGLPLLHVLHVFRRDRGGGRAHRGGARRGRGGRRRRLGEGEAGGEGEGAGGGEEAGQHRGLRGRLSHPSGTPETPLPRLGCPLGNMLAREAGPDLERTYSPPVGWTSPDPTEPDLPKPPFARRKPIPMPGRRRDGSPSGLRRDALPRLGAARRSQGDRHRQRQRHRRGGRARRRARGRRRADRLSRRARGRPRDRQAGRIRRSAGGAGAGRHRGPGSLPRRRREGGGGVRAGRHAGHQRRPLEHFPTKCMPVRRRKCRKTKNRESFAIATRS